MHRKFLRDTFICLVPVLVCVYIVTAAYFNLGKTRFKLGVDLVGGTILVYEIDQGLTKELNERRDKQGGSPRDNSDPLAGVGMDSEEMAKLAAALKRRIDPADLKNVTIRPIGRTRVEIIMPTGGQGQPGTGRSDFSINEVEETKALIRRVGTLEFRILANSHDDNEAIQSATNFFNIAELERESKEKAVERRNLLETRAREGLPPPFPPKEGGGKYSALGEEAEYAWVELGKEERQTLKLDNAQETAQTPSDLWRRMAEARKNNEVYLVKDSSEGLSTSYLLYSRPCVSNRLSPADRKEKKYEYFILTRSSDSVKVGDRITINATIDSGGLGKGIAVAFTFNSVGANQFHKITSKNEPDRRAANVARQLAILLDGYLTSAPRVISAISDRGQITGNYTHEQASQLVQILRSGALTAVLKPQPVSENTIGATLGADTIKSGTLAVGMAFLTVLVFMLFYYRFAGMVASIALLANLLLTIGFMVLVNATFTLPGLAGLVLMLGMAVDANVLIYERLREERDRGASLQVAIRNGYDRAFGTIIDTHLTSIFTAIVLYAVGNDQLKGFGVSLTAGLVISLFTSLFMTRLLFDYWLKRNWLKRLKMLRFFTRPNINFMAIRKPVFAFTIVTAVLGVGLFLYRGEQGVNVDFVGGTAYGGQLQPTKEHRFGLDITSLRTLLAEPRQKQLLAVAEVRELNQEGGFPNTYQIGYTDGSRSTVTLGHAPLEGKQTTPEERAQNVKERASTLPDWSVEQIFVSGASEGDESRFFTVRTTEKEPELVQLSLDRLFRTDPKEGEEADNSLLVKTVFEYAKASETSWELRFYSPDGYANLVGYRKNIEPATPALRALGVPVEVLALPDAPTSPSYVKTLIEREFRVRLGEKLGNEEAFSLQGSDPVALEGRHRTMTLQLTEAVQKIRGGVDVTEILAAAQRTFAQRPQPERLETFDPTLAADMRSRAFYAILASWLAILLYLWFRFGNWTFGAAAVACLVHDLCFTLGAIAACHYVHDTFLGRLLRLQDFKIDLVAVAALLTLVGYSVNEIIVNFARIREVRGKNPELTPQTINNSVNQTLSRTILTSMTVFLVSIVLYAAGGEGVHLFAFVMLTGVLVSTFSSIYVASPLLLIFGEGRPQTQTQAVRAPQPEAAPA